MWNKARNSLVAHIGFLFVLSFVFIGLLWLFFYTQQKMRQQADDMGRYINTATTLQPFLIQAIPIYDDDLSVLDMKLHKKIITKNYQLLYKKGDDKKGFAVYEFENKKLLHIYNHIDEVLLEDTKKAQNISIVHIVFLILLISQILLSIRVRKLLRPLSLITNKLRTIEDGDLSALSFDTNYDEIKHMVLSYNKAVAKIQYILDTREMFSKIFMHELKMPIAKAMFHLKADISQNTHDKLKDILDQLNQELDKFAQLESLISHHERINDTPNNMIDTINEAVAKINTIQKNNIHINCSKTTTINGDRQLWVICFKNILENALKYSANNRVNICCSDGKISFQNIGQPLPIDISGDITNWKLTKNQRNKSSTGYGFGLFIIKTITTINRYKLQYSYDKQNKQIDITIFR